MNKFENRRNFLIFVAILALVFINCIANLVKLNVFALVVNVILVIFVCFILGYNYCKCEGIENKSNEVVECEEPESFSDAIVRMAFEGVQIEK